MISAAAVLEFQDDQEQETAHTADDYQTNLIRLSSEFYSLIQDDVTEEGKRRLGDLHRAIGVDLQKFRKASLMEGLAAI